MSTQHKTSNTYSPILNQRELCLVIDALANYVPPAEDQVPAESYNSLRRRLEDLENSKPKVETVKGGTFAEAFARFFAWNACEESVKEIDQAYGNMVKTAINYWGAIVIDVRMDEDTERVDGHAEFKLRFPDRSTLWIDALNAYISADQDTGAQA